MNEETLREELRTHKPNLSAIGCTQEEGVVKGLWKMKKEKTLGLDEVPADMLH